MQATEEIGRRVLVLAPIGRDASTVADLLARADIVACICADYDALLAGLGEGAGAAFVAEEGLFGHDLDRLAGWVAAQPPWSDLPIAMLSSRHRHPQVTAWRRDQVARLGNVSLIERPVEPITLVSVMQAALRARKRQLEIRDFMEAHAAAAAGLEALVEQRTAQLQAVNLQLRDEMAERARVEESLRHTQKLESLGQLTGGVAHDFNNILMVISAGLEMLEMSDRPERRERMLRGMRQATQRGAGLTRQLLAFSRSRALRPETVHLPRLVGDMAELLHGSLRGDIRLQLELSPDLWPVLVDPGELELAILNLAVNARDAMAGSGTITISGRNVVEDAINETGEFVHLAIRDTGSGMSEEVQARVFEPFFTTKDVGKGSGLGLAQVYGFARQSGGSVAIDSEPGQGATITLRLPRSHQTPTASAGIESHVAEATGSSTDCVLLVEDDAEVAAFVEELLHGIGYEVIHAASAKAALGALANNRQVAFVFSDIMMPGGTSGIDLAREIRQRRPELPVLLTSGFAGAGGDEAAKLGIEILRKPYGLDDLRAAVARVRGAGPAAEHIASP
ncbi:ATP-binding protein [Pseudoxanthomonas daejeonensis]|uniref:histidine kinase n=1 Tax=Pseudoxanthomonas daejeonensis TaxID=266062 RepID=A0ABQ6Z5E6_9GAMM|nr:ATP-binding protein [Pseudoxanthomonas daejeonensis]KAF1692868.1 hybrid sensor histidine kinase/response regulator [Pseudoxanthomonas daejeonensis]